MKNSVVLGTFGNASYKDLLSAVDASVSNGIKAFDTAPSYGTEKLLGKALKTIMSFHQIDRSDLFVSDKVDAWQMQERNGDVRCYVENAVSEMNVQYLDLLFIHWPVEYYLQRSWECMLRMKEDGLVKNIGI